MEYWYSRGLYPLIASFQGWINRWLFISLGELFLAIGLVVAIVIFMRWFKDLRYAPEKAIPKGMRSLITLILLALVAFNGLWGLNYGRLPISTSVNVPVSQPTIKELEEVTYWLADQAALERKKIDWALVEETATSKLLSGVDGAFYQLPDRLNFLSFGGTQPKLLGSSIYFSYAGIAGIYNPFTGEGNINHMAPTHTLPVTAAHELAHYRGITREDEANFIAWAVCAYSDDPLYAYSGHVLAMIHSSNALYSVDKPAWEAFMVQLDPGIKEDLQKSRDFWNTYEGWFEEVNREVNDQYLKANKQAEGVKSYGRMVDLLIGWKRLAD